MHGQHSIFVKRETLNAWEDTQAMPIQVSNSLKHGSQVMMCSTSGEGQVHQCLMPAIQVLFSRYVGEIRQGR